MGGLREYLEEKSLLEKPFYAYFLAVRGIRGLLFLSLFLSLPFVFRMLQLNEEEKQLRDSLFKIEEKRAQELMINQKLGKELKFLQNPVFLEYKLLEELGVVPRGASIIPLQEDRP